MHKDKDVELIRVIKSGLDELVGSGALAGIVLTDKSYDKFKAILSFHSVPFRVAEIELDPAMEHSFVVDGLLIMRGTQLS